MIDFEEISKGVLALMFFALMAFCLVGTPLIMVYLWWTGA